MTAPGFVRPPPTGVDLANDFHTYYNAHTFIVDDAGLRDARLTLISVTRTVIASGLDILGVSAPEAM